ncbi:hypothetical protein MTR_6g465000 [Medicago truncatula]|uniref:Uncharacterized protein n=1 Tax=Medicago truncatula TaxID=3880 RepID=A0A072UAA0_MEDTR|nr:hypothetical protein MTR_6g465000 [Medicago truncatula]
MLSDGDSIGKEDGYKKGQSRLCDINGDAHESLDDVGIELAELSLDEPDLEADLYLDDVNGGEKIETINIVN